MKHLFLFFALSCAAVPPPPPAPPPPGASCLDACRHLRELGCPAGLPTARGATCTDVCENIQNSGIVRWDLTCMATATSCRTTSTCQRPVD